MSRRTNRILKLLSEDQEHVREDLEVVIWAEKLSEAEKHAEHLMHNCITCPTTNRCGDEGKDINLR